MKNYEKNTPLFIETGKIDMKIDKAAFFAYKQKREKEKREIEKRKHDEEIQQYREKIETDIVWKIRENIHGNEIKYKSKNEIICEISERTKTNIDEIEQKYMHKVDEIYYDILHNIINWKLYTKIYNIIKCKKLHYHYGHTSNGEFVICDHQNNKLYCYFCYDLLKNRYEGLGVKRNREYLLEKNIWDELIQYRELEFVVCNSKFLNYNIVFTKLSPDQFDDILLSNNINTHKNVINSKNAIVNGVHNFGVLKRTGKLKIEII